jgi:VIT1/CCC1 family predicted Fe2+/Mn2+ transporter
VRDFEDMRKRPVKASYEFTFEKTDEAMPQQRPRGLFNSVRRRSSSKTSTEDLESKSPSLKSTLTSQSRRVSDFDRATTVMRAVNRFGRPIGLAQRRAAKQIRLSHRSIAGVEDWERDFKLQNLNQKTQKEEKRKMQAEAFWQTIRRFGMAVAGGIALIIPVVIMTLYEGLVQSLVTTSVATFLFAIFVTWYSNANEKDIIAATAAYAAVLVVFVGTSLSIPSSTTTTQTP